MPDQRVTTTSREQMALSTLRDRADAIARQVRLIEREPVDGELVDALAAVAALLAEQAEALVQLHEQVAHRRVARFALGGEAGM